MVPGQHDAGGEGHHGRIPGPPPGHPGRGQHRDDPDGRDQGGIDVEVAQDPGVVDALAGDKPGGGTGDEPHQDRIFEEASLAEEREGAIAQAAVPEEFREVGVAGGVELAGGFPAVGPAVALEAESRPTPPAR